MPVEIRPVGTDSLALYATVPISFQVRSVLRVEEMDQGLGGFTLVEEAVDPPYLKDYDSQEEDADPTGWPKRFDVSNWGFFLALEGDRAVGGAAVAIYTPGVHMLEGSRDLAVLWDIRVHPQERGRGIGAQLLQQAADWAREKGCHRLKIETQNVNVPACCFYAKQGCTLGAIHRYAYAGHPQVGHEVMLLWYLDL